ncbi:hypothetical protein AB0L59_38785 [Streptomyces sp. NPDC052109]|uniref:hypothetical protein n=1 Tax=Streptomyces sp. NPDC052109 TaxID=3155527 RepID=UPI00342C9455
MRRRRRPPEHEIGDALLERIERLERAVSDQRRQTEALRADVTLVIGELAAILRLFEFLRPDRAAGASDGGASHGDATGSDAPDGGT